MSEPTNIKLHENPALFRQAVAFTFAQTGFNPRLIEKDYFCTVLLAYLARHGGSQLVFKGGTCLAKVHAGFYRLSEDLDFVIPLPVDASRTTRSRAVSTIREAVADVAVHIPVFALAGSFKGANNSTQYSGTVEYQSPATGQRENILIDVSVREPLLLPSQNAPARTLLLDPARNETALPPVTVNCIAMDEAMAEKFRAALTRKGVAIRDFYDLDHAVEHLGLAPDNASLVSLIRQKLAVPGTTPMDVSRERFDPLTEQLETQLRTVLRETEFQAFDLDRAIRLVTAMAERLG